MDRDGHLRQAESNLGALRALRQFNPPYHDWCVTMLFYVAVHFVDAYLATHGSAGIHPRNHDHRKKAMQRIPALDPIYAIYCTIENHSRGARYEGVVFTPQDVAGVESRLQQIDSLIAGLLGIPAPVH